MNGKDIALIVEGWDYNPHEVRARWVKTKSGEAEVQLRLDLGVLQMRAEGRPDGQTPRGFPSLLDYYEDLEQTVPDDHPSLQFDEDACAELQQEAVQYYYRYLAFSALGHLEGVIADTEHDLAIFDLVAEHAIDDDIAWQFIQFFPYVRMMNSKALAEKGLREKNYDEALAAVEEGLCDIRNFMLDYTDEDEDFEDCPEISTLQSLQHKIIKMRPKSEADRLADELAASIASENYEHAARLRDRLKKLGRAPF